MLRIVWVMMAIGAIVLLVACSSDDSSSSTSTAGSTTPTTTGTTTAGAPCGGTSTVEAAVRESPVAGLSEVSDKYDVSGVRSAASAPTWARFDNPPKAGVTDFQGGYGVAHCESGAWVVQDAGTSDVGCAGGTIPAVPPAVRADLGLECTGP
ncbi:MAG: hypothetical protein MUP97_03080 [Acidimicrobiia bacterium]|nr:hypothetical protein [Acidimicrobiia bacterium]